MTFGAKIALHHLGVHTEKAVVWCYTWHQEICSMEMDDQFWLL